MIARLFAVLVVGLASCASSDQPLPNDAIRDVATAIRAGQDACLAAWAIPRARQETNWKAELHNRIWHVWQQYKACTGFDSYLDAATGHQVGGCSVCVT